MGDLHLQAEAEKHFGFLVSMRGYKCTVSMPFLVRFESTNTFIELVFDWNRSYELRLLVGKKYSDEHPFRLDEIMRLRHAPEAATYALVQVSSVEELSELVKDYAKVLQKYGNDLISGSEKHFTELTVQRNREVKEYALKQDLQAARNIVDKAWHLRDYKTVVNALKPLQAALSPAELSKLNYAEQKMKGS